MKTALIVCLLAAGAAPTPSPAPRIDFAETAFNAGTVWEGDKAAHSFSFTNVGDTDLVIDRVKTSCGCTAALVTQKTVPPGAEGTIKVEFNTTRRSGNQRKTVYVYSNDPGLPNAQLEISCYVQTVAAFEPRSVVFQEVVHGEGAAQTVSLVPAAGPFRITSVSATPQFIAATVPSGEMEVGADNRPVEVEVRVLPDAPIGQHSGTLLAKLDHPQCPQINARIRVNVVGLISYSPRMFFFNRDNLVRHEEKVIVITKQGEPDLRVTRPQISLEGFSLDLQETVPGREFHLTVRPEGEPIPGRRRGTLSFQTNDPSQPRIELPMTAYYPEDRPGA
ncbi:MAG TPA: DUF1573 domain-containing protein [bacterium]|nr:DUF1573 domain-containing protein [bacterium]HPJ72566.1 DUF1573 domain-containing protein [bacterium]HPQ66372.1 DUF1573 domain-containing protein [bacterium]